MPINIYSNRIERILDNLLCVAPESQDEAIETVKNWLTGEWLLSKMREEEYLYLREVVVNEVAKKIIEKL